MISFFKTIVYIPLYNLFVLILNIDWIDAGIAAVVLTILVKIILYPLSKKSAITQIKLKQKQKELLSIKDKYKDKQEQALKVMEFYRVNNINPLTSILIVIIQIPIVFSLYYIFFKSGLPNVDTNIVYSFIKIPEQVSMMFLGFFDISKKSLFFALLAAISTFWQMHNSSNNTSIDNQNSDDFSAVLAKQMKYTMPIVVFFISWQISGVVALYWFVSNVVGVAQDVYIKRKFILN